MPTQKENKMYSQRRGNIPVMRYCMYSCIYCNFHRFLKLSPCAKCKDNQNHVHLEVLNRTPPKTADDQFLTIGLAGDVSFMGIHDFMDVLTYCQKWKDRIFLIQSKNPDFFVQFKNNLPENVILGTTLETNFNEFLGNVQYPYYSHISSAPSTEKRYSAMKRLSCRKAVTIEPILDFDTATMYDWILNISPEFVYVGYANDEHNGTKFKFPEPALEKTQMLIALLEDVGIDVRQKTMRKAWDELK